jgi:hypothetical protein
MFACSPSFFRFQRSFRSYPDLLRWSAVRIEALNQTDREQYLDLAVFPEDQPVPESALIVLWKLDEIATRDRMTRSLVGITISGLVPQWPGDSIGAASRL